MRCVRCIAATLGAARHRNDATAVTARSVFEERLPPDIGRECARRRRGYFGCTTVIVAGDDLPTPRSRGRYMSSTSDGGTVYVPGVTARTR